MADMIVSTPEIKKTIEDYDIIFSSGMAMPVSMDPALGDTVSFGEATIEFDLVPKPSINDPEKMLPGEKITIFKSHVISIQHRKREVIELSPEQQFAWHRSVQGMVN
jgi:hypothetical protein